MAHKSPLTFEEHKALGERLCTARETLLDAGLTVAKHYNKTSKEARQLFKVVDDIDAVRCLLDDHVFDEYHIKSTEELSHVYYPKRGV